MQQATPDDELIQRLRARDEAAFMELVDRLTPAMRRVARMFVASDAVADECVQEAWLGVLQGIDRFEGRSTLRTWVFRILVNIAKTKGQREARSVPFATLAGDDLDQPTWDPSVARDDRVLAVAACTPAMKTLARTPALPARYTCEELRARGVASVPRDGFDLLEEPDGGLVHAAIVPVLDDERAVGELVVAPTLPMKTPTR